MGGDGRRAAGGDHDWLRQAKALLAIAQTGIAYARDPFDVERYGAVRRIAAELLADGGRDDVDRVLDLFRDERGYATPKVAVNAAVFRDDAILLVRRQRAAVEREVAEESGYRVRADRLLAVYDRDHPRHGHPPQRSHIYKLFFACELLDDAAAPLPDDGETDAIGFFAPDALPPLSLARVTPRQIARFFAMRAPGLADRLRLSPAEAGRAPAAVGPATRRPTRDRGG